MAVAEARPHARRGASRTSSRCGPWRGLGGRRSLCLTVALLCGSGLVTGASARSLTGARFKSLRAAGVESSSQHGDGAADVPDVKLDKMEFLMNSQLATIQYQQMALKALEAEQEKIEMKQAAMREQETKVDQLLMTVQSTKASSRLWRVLGQETNFAWQAGALILFLFLMGWVSLDIFLRNARSAARLAGEKTSQKVRDCETRSRLGPTLYLDKFADPPVYQPACIWALAALGDPGFNGVYKLHEDLAMELLRKIEADDGIGHNDDGSLDLKELLNFTSNPKHTAYIESLPVGCHGLLVEDHVRAAFRVFDKDKSGTLEKGEWMKFLDTLAYYHLEYLHRMALIGFRGYWGRAQRYPSLHAGVVHRSEISLLREDLMGAASQTLTKPPGIVQIGRDRDVSEGDVSFFFFPRGWFSDLWYHTANNHPLLGIVLCDPMHPLSSVERLMIEVSTISLSYTSAYVRRAVQAGNPPFGLTFLSNNNYFRLCVVTLPGIVVWWVLFILFTTPHFGHVDLARATRAQVRNKWIIRQVCGCVGYALLATALFFFAFEVITLLDETRTIFEGRMLGYIISSLQTLFIYFNAIFAWGDPGVPEKWSMLSAGGIGDMIGFGQWRIEKRRLHCCCCHSAACSSVYALKARNSPQPY
eukprot:TRINITY_DN23018_c0_g3_i1.p1 TRINITY_DN23018_c0_g3~~TRINITY_DN23018_c0_g3_i1.p1  ORF type:complete len:645 (-),score=128.40 TRINITY_DN23018_c0_g3_i1:537-2471(-)